MKRSGIAVGVCLAALSACADFPELARAVPASELSGSYPPLLPIDQLLAQTDDPLIEDEDTERLEARANALRARADRLRRY